MASSELKTANCLECGAGVSGEQRKMECCWLCGARWESPWYGLARPPVTAQQQAGNTFGLATLIVVVAFCAVLVGVFLESIGLGILLAIVGTPSLIATFVIAAQRESTGRPMTMLDELANFMVAAGTVVGMLLTSGIASGVGFFIQCLQPW